jgi:predicted RNase H-like nuclease (RuvC/YqgF family)
MADPKSGKDDSQTTTAAPDTEAPETSAEAIAKNKGKRRSLEEKVSWLEDENDKLKGKTSTLENTLKEISDMLKTKPSSTPAQKSLWDEINQWLES